MRHMPVIRAIIFSFSFHIALILGLLFLVPLLMTEDKKTEPIEIAIVAPNTPVKSQPAKTIVRQADISKEMQVPEDETLARFLSEKKQRVRQETQAAQSGMTENRANTRSGSEQKAAEPKQKSPEESETDKDGYRTVDISKDLQEMNRMNQGMSSVGESLPRDVKVGSFTALNTDRYLFYTFYARIEESVRYRWESRVEQAIRNLNPSMMVNMGNRNWVTNVEFLLDKKGYLKKAMIMKSSGTTSFDQAAVRAFQEAAVFPNPPQEMIQDDGFIHIQFSFTVNFRPPTLVNSNSYN